MADKVPFDSKYGWEWGPIQITRVSDDPKYGYVLQVSTENAPGYVEIRTSPKGYKLTVKQALFAEKQEEGNE